MIPAGRLCGVCSARGLFCPADAKSRYELVRAISRLNAALEDKQFICIGPGRWGSSNSDLGVPSITAISTTPARWSSWPGAGIGPAPEPSLGTHFFQDLLEAQIYPLAIYLDDPQTIFQHDFFNDSPNHLTEFISADATMESALRLIRVADYRKGHYMRVVMNDEKSLAVAFLEKE